MRRSRDEGYSSYPGRSAGYAPNRSNPHRKVVAEPAEVSTAHSTREMANDQEGTDGWQRPTKEVNTYDDMSCSAEI